MLFDEVLKIVLNIWYDSSANTNLSLNVGTDIAPSANTNLSLHAGDDIVSLFFCATILCFSVYGRC